MASIAGKDVAAVKTTTRSRTRSSGYGRITDDKLVAALRERGVVFEVTQPPTPPAAASDDVKTDAPATTTSTKKKRKKAKFEEAKKESDHQKKRTRREKRKEEMKVTPEMYGAVERRAKEEAKALVAARVDTRCTLEILVAERSVRLRGDKEGPWLCLVKGTKEGADVAVLTMVNTVTYLRRPGNWQAFANKAAYCASTGRALYAWIGDLPEAVLQARNAVPWLACRERHNTLNIYKTLAFLATFERRRRDLGEDRAAGLPTLYLDADAWFSRAADVSAPEAYFNLSRNTFLLGNQNRAGRSTIVLNGGILGVRDVKSARRFLAVWFFSRCGSHDQLPLWATLFAYWSAKTAVSIRVFRDYKTAHEFSPAALASNLPAFRGHVLRQDPANTFDGGDFQQTHLLVETPLELPGVLLLPSAAVGDLPALRSDVDLDNPTFCCHTRLDRSEHDQCRGIDTCAHSRCAPFFYQDNHAPANGRPTRRRRAGEESHFS